MGQGLWKETVVEMLTSRSIFKQEFWTYEVSDSIVSIYSIPMWLRADYHDNVWVKYEDRLIATPSNEKVAKAICLEHNANALHYHKNSGNVHDIYEHFKCMVGFLAAYTDRHQGHGLSEITHIPQAGGITYINTNWKRWMKPRAISAVYPKIIGSNEFIIDCVYPKCFSRCARWCHCDIKVGGKR